ncbi:LPXTG cell wall anchor domain-containing protein [Vagococcus coleopterorum]|uniref:LPXTG cell wall anchor domain-containing protein n=1 Tax=Vagococcus coleopterorum TaxID=2714946 RepID=A0A6G8ANF6_9ENTE|nr:LPXTG cell wall anchor domain-containing protein [Vagococcus coleopterorum]QIL46527.1 LPXTG cell wall anchor domain-containing protein [Vagococcus coleopterorum]
MKKTIQFNKLLVLITIAFTIQSSKSIAVESSELNLSNFNNSEMKAETLNNIDNLQNSEELRDFSRPTIRMSADPSVLQTKLDEYFKSDAFTGAWDSLVNKLVKSKPFEVVTQDFTSEFNKPISSKQNGFKVGRFLDGDFVTHDISADQKTRPYSSEDAPHNDIKEGGRIELPVGENKLESENDQDVIFSWTADKENLQINLEKRVAVQGSLDLAVVFENLSYVIGTFGAGTNSPDAEGETSYQASFKIPAYSAVQVNYRGLPNEVASKVHYDQVGNTITVKSIEAPAGYRLKGESIREITFTDKVEDVDFEYEPIPEIEDKSSLELTADSVDLEFGSEWSPGNYIKQATNDFGEDVKLKVEVSGDNVTTTCPGSYTVIYKLPETNQDSMKMAELKVTVKEKPTDPEKPTTPEKPTDPEKPTTPEKPGETPKDSEVEPEGEKTPESSKVSTQSETKKESKEKAGALPQTGEARNNLMKAAGALVILIATTAYLVINRRKKA